MTAAKILALFALCVACAKPTPAAPEVRLTYHADVNFTPHERALMGEAVRRLEPFVHVNVTWDLSEAMLIGFQHENRIARALEGFDYVPALDAEFKGTVYGWTYFASPVRTFIVADRLKTDRQWVHVLMHELLHGACADHVKDPRAVMYHYSDDAHLAIDVTPADVEELRRCTAGK